MNFLHRALRSFFTAVLVTMTLPTLVHADSRDGQHDFDFAKGTWRTHISRLQHPLSGSKSWTAMNGVVVVKDVFEGHGQIEEIEADGDGTHFESLTLFLYDPQSHQWRISFANSRDGALAQPAIGSFANGRGEFFDQETFDGRTVWLRVTWSKITATSHHFEQAFSTDAGKSWETNFVADLTRASDGTPTTVAPLAAEPQSQHAFDFQFGAWAIHSNRMKAPLTGSNEWTGYDGTVVVRKLWNGRANLAEIKSEGPSGKLQFLSLRLFNPKTQQWSLNFASMKDGTLSTPMFGEFKDGRGEFTDQEPDQDRMIWVRFVFDQIQSGSHRDEQAFSVDNGRSWEVNWINESKKLPRSDDPPAHS